MIETDLGWGVPKQEVPYYLQSSSSYSGAKGFARSLSIEEIGRGLSELLSNLWQSFKEISSALEKGATSLKSILSPSRETVSQSKIADSVSKPSDPLKKEASSEESLSSLQGVYLSPPERILFPTPPEPFELKGLPPVHSSTSASSSPSLNWEFDYAVSYRMYVLQWLLGLHDRLSNKLLPLIAQAMNNPNFNQGHQAQGQGVVNQPQDPNQGEIDQDMIFANLQDPNQEAANQPQGQNQGEGDENVIFINFQDLNQEAANQPQGQNQGRFWIDFSTFPLKVLGEFRYEKGALIMPFLVKYVSALNSGDAAKSFGFFSTVMGGMGGIKNLWTERNKIRRNGGSLLEKIRAAKWVFDNIKDGVALVLSFLEDEIDMPKGSCLIPFVIADAGALFINSLAVYHKSYSFTEMQRDLGRNHADLTKAYWAIMSWIKLPYFIINWVSPYQSSHPYASLILTFSSTYFGFLFAFFLFLYLVPYLPWLKRFLFVFFFIGGLVMQICVGIPLGIRESIACALFSLVLFVLARKNYIQNIPKIGNQEGNRRDIIGKRMRKTLSSWMIVIWTCILWTIWYLRDKSSAQLVKNLGDN